MTEKKNAFDWRDRSGIRKRCWRKAEHQAAQAKIGLHEKKQVTAYSHAKSSK
jgi:hypothetical protein